MKKVFNKHVRFLLISAAGMILLPALVSCFPRELTFIATVLLFLVINPLFALILGICAGRDMQHMWYLPILTGFLYWAGTVLFITEWWNTSILFYVAAYVLIGVAAMIITHFVRHFRAGA